MTWRGSIIRAGILGTRKVLSYGPRISAAVQADPRILLLGSSGGIKEGPYAR